MNENEASEFQKMEFYDLLTQAVNDIDRAIRKAISRLKTGSKSERLNFCYDELLNRYEYQSERFWQSRKRGDWDDIESNCPKPTIDNAVRTYGRDIWQYDDINKRRWLYEEDEDIEVPGFNCIADEEAFLAQYKEVEVN
jgi:hypothetical protein